MQKTTTRLLIVTLTALGLVFTAGYGRAGEAKQALENALIGTWQVPENKYQEEISFDFTAARTFECVHAMPKKEPVTWSGNWKVRTTSTGAVKAYLKARNQADPEQYMKAIITCDKALEVFAVDIVFNFKSPDKSNWSSKLERASDDGGDEDLEEDEGDGGDEGDEDIEDDGDIEDDEDL
jgi:hypothetical protein